MSTTIHAFHNAVTCLTSPQWCQRIINGRCRTWACRWH